MNHAVPARADLPRLWIVAGISALTLVAVIAAGLWQLRREAINSQTRELGMLSLALSDELDRGLQGVKVGLQTLRLELHEGRLPTRRDEADLSLHARALQWPLARQLWVLTEEGRVVAASGAAPPPELSSFAPALHTLEGEAVAVSRPFQDLVSHEWSVALAMRFVGAPGQPGGWVVAGMPSEALRGAFIAASPAADARMAVYRSDGVRLSGSMIERIAPDTPEQEARLAARLSPESAADLSVLPDGSQRLLELRSLPRFGLKLVLARDLQAVLVPWREVQWLATSGLLLLLAGLGLSVLLLQRAERRRHLSQQALKDQLSRTNKLESLGTLAGSVAHDFNNVLAAVLGYGEMARNKAPEGSAQARQLDHVLQAALRGKSLVERILAFSRGGARSSTVFEVQPLVDEVLNLLAASLRPGIALQRHLDAPGLKLQGDATQIFEAIMNLCTNAMEAMPQGGVLGVSLVRHQTAKALPLSHGSLAPGAYMALTVSDQGVGITPDVMEHLFEPFFTTRSEHAGTGLGLAVVHGVVAEFGGAIDVRSSPGLGARFTLYFPEALGPVTARPSLPAEPPSGRGQTLLVVDDDPALVELAEEWLAELGYEPVGFSDPATALEALRADPQRFDAVLTDEVMPRLTGTQLTMALRAFAPSIPVLLISGYGGPQLAARAAQAGVTRVLTKPLQRADLARALVQVIHDPAH